MKSIEWNQCLCIGIDDLDEQHFNIIKSAIALLEAVKNSSYDKIYSRLRKFSKIVSTHFRFEEKFMLKCHYQNIEDHTQQHIQLEETLNYFVDKTSQDNLITEDDVLDLVTKFTRVVMTHDVSIHEYLKYYCEYHAW